MVNVLAASAVDCGFVLRSHQIKDNTLGWLVYDVLHHFQQNFS
jgi:hypothetical protein